MKNNRDNQIQNITLRNMYFLIKVYAVYHGVWGKASEAGGIFQRIFVLKVTLQSIRLLLTVLQKKKLREQDVLVAPPVIFFWGGEQGE